MKIAPTSTRAILPPVPLGLARSALFGVARPSGKILERQEIATAPLRGASLLYSGPQLSQYHALAWQAVLQEAEEQKTTGEAPFTVAADTLLRAMGGKGNDHKQRARLWDWLRDLTAARIDYTTTTHHYAGPLLYEVERETVGGRLALKVDATLLHLVSDEVLRNDLARKSRLGRNLLALWLHDYLATHLRPPPDAVAALRVLCGSPLALPQFRSRLRETLDLLASDRDPLLRSWQIDRRDCLIVQKVPTRVVILPTQVAGKRKIGVQAHTRAQAQIDQARQGRARVAL